MKKKKLLIFFSQTIVSFMFHKGAIERLLQKDSFSGSFSLFIGIIGDIEGTIKEVGLVLDVKFRDFVMSDHRIIKILRDFGFHVFFVFRVNNGDLFGFVFGGFLLVFLTIAYVGLFFFQTRRSGQKFAF